MRDLDRAVDIARELVTTAAGPDRAMCLDTVGNALTERYDATGNIDDLRSALDAHEEAVRITPADSPWRAGRLDDWGSTRLQLHRLTGDREDLARVVEMREALVGRIGPESPDRVKFLNNLGLSLLAEAAHDLDPRLRDRITAVFREACEIGLDSSPGEVLSAAGSWGGWAAARSAWSEAATAYEFGLTAMERLFRVQPLRRHQEVWLATAGQVASEAGFASVRTGRLARAVENLERGRGMLLAEALDRGRADLRRLDELGDRFVRATIMASRAGAG